MVTIDLWRAFDAMEFKQTLQTCREKGARWTRGVMTPWAHGEVVLDGAPPVLLPARGGRTGAAEMMMALADEVTEAAGMLADSWQAAGRGWGGGQHHPWPGLWTICSFLPEGSRKPGK